MAVIATVSAKGAPGASTAALALTLSWSGRIVLAECDPAGGDILAGYLSNLAIPGDHGLLKLARPDLREQLPVAFWGQLIDLDAPHRRRLVLPGLSDPAQATALRPTWPRLAELLAGLETADPGYDVIADCGRLGPHSPWPVLESADLVLLVLRAGGLRDISPASPALAVLRRQLSSAASRAGLGLLLVGEDTVGRRELQRLLRVPVLARLPDDRRTADALCGVGRLRGSKDLLRHAASAEPKLRAAIARARTPAAMPDAAPAREVHSGT